MKVSNEMRRVRAAVDAANAALANRRKIKDAIKAAEDGLPVAQVELEQALKQLGDIEVRIALGDAGDPKQTAQIRRRVAESREKLDALTVRGPALQQHMVTTEAALLQAETELRQARSEYNRAVVAEFRERFITALAPVRDLMREAHGLMEAGIQLRGAVHETRLVDPLDGSVLPLFANKQTDAGRWVEAWDADPVAKAAFDSHSEIARLARALDREAEAIRREQHSRASSEPRPQPSVRTIDYGGTPEAPGSPLGRVVTGVGLA